MFTRPGNLARRFVSQLLAKDSVFATVQRTLLSSLDARRAFDRNVGRVLAGLNLPSNQEVDRLYEDVRALERDISDLTQQTERLLEVAQAQRREAGRD